MKRFIAIAGEIFFSSALDTHDRVNAKNITQTIIINS